LFFFFVSYHIFTFQKSAKDLIGFTNGTLVPKNLTKFSLKSNRNPISKQSTIFRLIQWKRCDLKQNKLVWKIVFPNSPWSVRTYLHPLCECTLSLVFLREHRNILLCLMMKSERAQSSLVKFEISVLNSRERGNFHLHCQFHIRQFDPNHFQFFLRNITINLITSMKWRYVRILGREQNEPKNFRYEECGNSKFWQFESFSSFWRTRKEGIGISLEVVCESEWNVSSVFLFRSLFEF
jgi:hypothetical protein